MLRLVLYALAGLLVLAIVGYFAAAAPIADARYNTVQAEPPYDASERAQAVHDALMVADLHNDLLLWPRDPRTRHERGHTDVPRLREGGMGLQVFAAVTQVPMGRSYAGTDADALDQLPFLAAAQRWPVRTWTSRLERARYQAQKLRRATARDEALVLLRTRADLNSLLGRRRETPSAMGTLLSVEGLHALEGRVANVDTLVDDGYRMMSLTHLHDNALGGSSTGLRNGGLTDFGAAVVDRLAARDVTIDLAHASEALIDDVLARTDGPRRGRRGNAPRRRPRGGGACGAWHRLRRHRLGPVRRHGPSAPHGGPPRRGVFSPRGRADHGRERRPPAAADPPGRRVRGVTNGGKSRDETSLRKNAGARTGTFTVVMLRTDGPPPGLVEDGTDPVWRAGHICPSTVGNEWGFPPTSTSTTPGGRRFF
ncbi:dipeptidase [Salinibacter altiplanensis]|uniref:dipeptidase n=1 Tax=Salinibacter altiplanensis TaxID=1803181 RepID=UPI0024342A80|nr:membrane dipeptidase [Salinibacter altiplanensis]